MKPHRTYGRSRSPISNRMPSGATTSRASSAPRIATSDAGAWGLTIREASRMAGLDERRWSRLERNRTTPTTDDKRRIAEALAFPASFFAMDDLVIDFRDSICWPTRAIDYY